MSGPHVCHESWIANSDLILYYDLQNYHNEHVTVRSPGGPWLLISLIHPRASMILSSPQTNSIRNRLVCNGPYYLTPLRWCSWHPCCSIMSSLLRYGTLLRQAHGAMPGQACVMPQGSTLSPWMKPDRSSVCSSCYRNAVEENIQWVKKCSFLHIDRKELPHVLLTTEVCLVGNVLIGTSSASVLSEALFLLCTEVSGYGCLYWQAVLLEFFNFKLHSVIRPLLAQCTNADKNAHSVGNYMKWTMDARELSWVK